MSMARRRTSARFLGLAALACLPAVLTLVAAMGTRTGLWGYGVGYDLLAQRVAFGLSFVGMLAALAAVFLTVRRQGSWLLALAAAAVAVATLAGFAWHKSRVAAAPVEDVSTDLAEVPGFDRLSAQRGAGGPARTVGAHQCPGAVPVPTQALPEAVVYVLQREGFGVRRAGVTGVYGTRRGFWFGFPYDVAVRIRPGRTDIRVAAREGRPHGGEACRLVGRISAALQPD